MAFASTRTSEATNLSACKLSQPQKIPHSSPNIGKITHIQNEFAKQSLHFFQLLIYFPATVESLAGFLAKANVLLENFADVDHRAFSGQTALMRASQQGNLKTCEWLPANGASLDKKDIYGKSALLLAAQEGWISMDPANIP